MKKTEMTDQDLKKDNVEQDTTVKVEFENAKDKSDNVINEDDSEETLEQEVETEEDTISRLESEINTINDKYLRLVAEFDNFRKRAAKEKTESRLTAGKEILIDLLPVLDDLYRAEEVVEKATDVSAVKEGFNLINIDTELPTTTISLIYDEDAITNSSRTFIDTIKEDKK